MCFLWKSHSGRIFWTLGVPGGANHVSEYSENIIFGNFGICRTLFISWGPDTWCPKSCEICRNKTPLSKIFKFFDPKFLHDFEGIVKYFSARNFGVQYVHPQGTFVGFPFWPQNGDFGQNPPKFRGVPPGCTPPKIFSVPKVMTLGYIQHKYLSVTRKTRRATEDWILVTFAFSSDYQWGKHPFRMHVHKNTGWKWANFEEVYLCEFCELRWDICVGYSIGSLLVERRKKLGGGATP